MKSKTKKFYHHQNPPTLSAKSWLNDSKVCAHVMGDSCWGLDLL
ncbi:hypothetical protein HPHPH43_0986 [Helicobacter pylori Hp H-43]|nr:hypothetical protein HPHPH43_0986 [Helicobacter pylori Hp H-43]